MLKCPRCGSENINQYRMLTGKIWCEDCKFKSDHKENYNPFTPNLEKFNKILIGFDSGLNELYLGDKVKCYIEYFQNKIEFDGYIEYNSSKFRMEIIGEYTCYMGSDDILGILKIGGTK